MQSSVDQPSQDRLGRLVAVKRETGDVGVRRTHRPMQRFDDVTADTEITQAPLEAELQCPRPNQAVPPSQGVRDWRRDLPVVQSGSSSASPGQQIGGRKCRGAIGRGPSNARHRPPSSPAGISCSLRDPNSSVTRSAARSRKPWADVVAVDDQVLPVVCAAAEEHMDVRIIDVPVIDRHPFQPWRPSRFPRRSSVPG